MAGTEHGVSYYKTGTAQVFVYFPNGDLKCKYCPYLSSNERICQLNKQPVYYPDKYLGAFCPLEITEEEKEE